jgi:polar amino acid transport system permease protein
MFNWGFALSILPALLHALVVTIEATILGFAVALAGGLVLALLRRSRHWIFFAPAAVFVECIRSTPLLVQAYFLFFVLPHFGITMSPWTTGILAIGMYYSCYASEAYRAGLESVPRGQWEAATALNFSSYRTYRDVVLPQALRPTVPVLGNYLIQMFKDTPILAAITVPELLQTAKVIGSDTFRFTEPFTIVGLLFLVLSLFSAAAIRFIEARLARWRT